MKRFFTSFLLMMAGAFMTTALADSYKIWIGGVQVTDLNKDNISPTGKTAGTIRYNSTNKMLLFQNVTMTTDKCCIDVEMEGVDVKFEGTNTFTSTGANTFYANCPVILCDYGETSATDAGNPRVTFNCTASGYYSALWFRSDGTLDIWGLYLTCTSNYYAIQGPDDASLSATLYLSSSEIKAESKNSSVGAITKFKSAYSRGGKMEGGVTYNTSNKRTEKSDGSAANSVTWKNGIYICGRMVNAEADSRRDVKHPNMTGTVYYLNKELILDGVTYNGSDRFIDNYNVENLKITCKGTNKITTSMHAILPRANTTITGTGSLSLTSTASSAISTYNGANVTVNIDMLEAKGADHGFYGEQAGTLTLNKYSSNSVYKFMGGNCNLYTGKLVMNNMDIWTTDSYFNSKVYKMYYNGAIATTSNGPSDGTWFKSTDQFTYYPLYVAGTQVNNRNSSNISSQYITSGTVTYNTSTKTLTLNGVQFEATGTDAPNGIDLRTDIGEATLKFTGADQHWTADNDVFAFANTKTTITGDCARVYLTSNKESGISTRGGASVTINKTGYFGSKGAKYGYWGNGATNEVLTLSKTTEDDFGYNFEGAQGAINNVYALNLDNMDFGYIDGKTLPGCYFDATKRCVAQNGGEIAKGAVTLSSIKEKLPIYVAGKQLNNVYNVDYAPIYVGSPYISSGPMSVNYVPSTKTLTLDNATTVEHGNTGSVLTCGMAVLDEGVTIDVVGNNNITAGNYGIWANKDLTIGGSGNLNIISTESGALGINDNANERTLTLQCSGGVHSFQGKTYGFRGWNTASLAINKKGSGALYKFSGETANIGTTKSLNLGDGVKIHSRYTYFDEEKKAVYNRGNIAKTSDIAQGTWIRGDIEWIEYPLYVCDQQLYGAYVDGDFKGLASGFNCKQYTGTGIYYNPESQTLTLNDVKIESDDVSDAVKNDGIDELTIKLIGESDIKVRDNVFQLRRNTTFIGDGTLRGEATADDGFGIWMSGGEDPELVLDGPTFEFKGQVAIGGQGQNNLSFNKGKLTFEPNDYPKSAFTALANVHFAANLAITEPEGAYYSKSLEAVTTDGANIYKGKVVVGEVTPYGLTIAGVGVNSANCTDILHDGVFSYDPVGNTLTISGDCTFNGWIVDSNIEDLTINVVGNSTLTQQGTTTAIRLFANTTITGGKLTLVSEDSDKASLGIYNSVGTLTIKDADIEVVGDGFEYGITGESECSLVIDNSSVSVSAHSCGCISDWGSVNLTNCYIETPETSNIKANGIYNGAGDHFIGGGDATETIVIKAGELTGINELGVRSEELGVGNGQSTYDLNGRKVTTPEKGKIYIINGKKVKK